MKSEKMHFIDIDITMDTLTQLSKRKVKKKKSKSDEFE